MSASTSPARRQSLARRRSTSTLATPRRTSGSRSIIARSSAGKLPIYAKLGVPEVWRYRTKGPTLVFVGLNDRGTYDPLERSRSLPMLTPARVLEALAMCAGISESAWDRRIREWVRNEFLAAPGPIAP